MKKIALEVSMAIHLRSDTTFWGLGGGRWQEDKHQRADAPPLKDVQPSGHVSQQMNMGSDRSVGQGRSLVPKKCYQEKLQAEKARAEFYRIHRQAVSR